MQQDLEKEIVLPNVTVQLFTLQWKGVGERPRDNGYSLFQRLSDDHSPLRIGNLSAPELLPRVRSVGFLPAGWPITLLPIEKPLRVLDCIYDQHFFETTTKIGKQQWEKHAGSLVTLKNQRLEILMQEIFAELEQPGFAHSFLIESVTNMLVVELARHLIQLERKNAKRGDSLALAPWQLSRIQERIQASLDLGYPGLGELANICGVSQGHLARSFKAATGWQLHKYIAEERLKTAKAMLAEEKFSCQEVALRLGFKNSGYFSTAFRRMTGKTPTEFRRQALATTTGNDQ